MKIEELGRKKQLKISLGDLLHWLCLSSVDIFGLTKYENTVIRSYINT